MLSSILDPRSFQFKKLRLLLAWTGGILLILNTHINDHSFAIGLPFVFLGELIRILASGYLERKGKKLATSGLFAYVRNPLYIGNFSLGLGFVLMSNSLINILLFLAGFTFLYLGTVKKEEAVLAAEFGEAYLDYCREVPRFFPRLTPYSKSSRDPFMWGSAVKHREYITIAGITLLISAFYIWKELSEEKTIQNFTGIYIAGGFITLATLGLIYEWIRKETAKRSL